jgi:hypothetical protein
MHTSQLSDSEIVLSGNDDGHINGTNVTQG